jgi:hypothetical protein
MNTPANETPKQANQPRQQIVSRVPGVMSNHWVLHVPSPLWRRGSGRLTVMKLSEFAPSL